MRSTASVAVLLAACGTVTREVRPHALEPGRAYEAIHELRLRTTGKTPDGQPFRRDVIRNETYVDHFLTLERVQREYDAYEITEEMAIGPDRPAPSNLDPGIEGVRITLLFEKGWWRLPKDAPDEIAALIGERTRVGPPRFWTGTSTKWRTFRGEPMLMFLGLGTFEKGTMRARFERWGRHEGAENALVTLEIEEEWERGKAVARGWMIHDLEWAMIAKVALNGKITRPTGKPEMFQATRTWSPVDKPP